VSKRKGHRKRKPRRKKPQKVICARCRAPSDGTPPSLLKALAVALSACGEAGMKVRLAHGAVVTREGFVLPLGDGQWTARTLAYDPFGPPPGDDDDD
jgi:hypothetical protein